MKNAFIFRKGKLQKSVREDHQRIKDCGLYLRNSSCFNADPDNDFLKKYF